MTDLRVRKNFYNMTREEKDKFIDAVLSLKSDGTYDNLVELHQQAMEHATPWEGDTGPSRRNAAHRGPAFLPWHRQYLQVYERELQRVSGDSSLSIPYWDWVTDGRLPDPKVAPLWRAEGIGGDGNPGFDTVIADFAFTVMDGPFARWPLAHNTADPPTPDVLQRHLGLFVAGLPTPCDHMRLMDISTYDAAGWDDNRQLRTFRNALEGWFVMPEGSRMHNQVHVWVGGCMLPGTSPNDPVFYMHHCFVDRLWADWQRLQAQTNPDLTASYQPHVDGPPGHNLDDPMFPWDSGDEIVRPRDVLDHHALGFRYENEPLSEVPAVETLAPSASAVKSPFVE